MMNRIKILDKISQVIFDKKGFNILAIDVRGLSTMTDYYLIAEGSVDRHVNSLKEAIKEQMSEEGETAIHIEGADTCDWIVMDYGDVLIHLFTPEFREKYALEEVWHDGKIVDVNLDISRKIG